MKDLLKTRVPGAARAVRSVYHLMDVYRSRPAYYLPRAPFLSGYDFDLLYWDGRGNHPRQHLDRTKKFASVRGAELLIVGCGSGDELALWLDEHPRRLVALDYFAAPGTWASLRARHPGRTLEFLRADGHALPFAAAQFDIVASDNVLEHLADPSRGIAEMFRVLRPGGLFFAGFVPLFWTYGGAHYDGGFEHLLMPRSEFYAWIVGRGRPEELEVCKKYLDHGLFSYWTVDQYMEAFSQFEPVYRVIHLSQKAFRYRRDHPVEWARLAGSRDERHLLMSGLSVWLRKPQALGESPSE